MLTKGDCSNALQSDSCAKNQMIITPIIIVVADLQTHPSQDRYQMAGATADIKMLLDRCNNLVWQKFISPCSRSLPSVSGWRSRLSQHSSVLPLTPRSRLSGHSVGRRADIHCSPLTNGSIVTSDKYKRCRQMEERARNVPSWCKNTADTDETGLNYPTSSLKSSHLNLWLKYDRTNQGLDVTTGS